jgi:hypothetical protein
MIKSLPTLARLATLALANPAERKNTDGDNTSITSRESWLGAHDKHDNNQIE